jgi:nicotinamidase-related amidase
VAQSNGQARERVWDRFLTEQDRAHVAMSSRREKGFGQRPALLIIDMYRWVFGDKPEPLLDAVKTWPGSCGLAGWDALPHVQDLLAAARTADIPIIHTTGADESVMTTWARGMRSSPASNGDSDAEQRKARKYDIIDEVAPRPGEMVVRKASPSAFWGTPLIGHLVDRGIDTILVAGESTSGCVRASVVDGCTYRFHMVVAEECVFDRHEATHAVELFTMHEKYADVLPLAQVLDYIRRVGPTPEIRAETIAARA